MLVLGGSAARVYSDRDRGRPSLPEVPTRKRRTQTLLVSAVKHGIDSLVGHPPVYTIQGYLAHKKQHPPLGPP